VSCKTIANHCTQLKARLAAPRTADPIRFAIASGLTRGADSAASALLPVQPD